MTRIAESFKKEDPEPSFFPVCNNCIWRTGAISCVAFSRIPEEILLGQNDHAKKLPDQKNEITFKSK